MAPTFEPSTQFSNAQLLLLKAFSCNLSEDELLKLRSAFANILGRRATAAADKVWDEKGWTNEDVERMLNTKMRSGRG